MENFSIVSSKFSLIVPTPNPFEVLTRRQSLHFSLPPHGARSRRIGGSSRRPGLVIFALSGGSSGRVSSSNGKEKLKAQVFGSASSSNNSETTTTSAVAPVPVPSSPTSIGSPLFWVGVGVGFSVVFQVVASRLKKYALQQAFKTMMDQAAPQGQQFGNPSFGSTSPFSFPIMATSPPTAPPPPSTRVSTQQPVMVDVAASKVESTTPSEAVNETQVEEAESKKFAFVDVSVEELLQSESSYIKDTNPVDTQSAKEIPPNGTVNPDRSASSEQSQYRPSPSLISVEALEKMMEDPTVQKMVYPYLPEEMRNPETFKWMMKNPQFRQQMQDMLNNMGGNNEWDNRLTDSLKNFNLSSPEVKQQFEQIGLTPEEVISKIMANPDVAMAFQNPKVQAAILDCSQNPLSIAKYQNDKEVMDVFTKISELFPGVSGYP